MNFAAGDTGLDKQREKKLASATAVGACPPGTKKAKIGGRWLFDKQRKKNWRALLRGGGGGKHIPLRKKTQIHDSRYSGS